MERRSHGADKLPCRAIALVAVLATACQTGAQSGYEQTPTLAIENYEFNLRRHIGRTVRVCGPLVEYEGEWAVQAVPEPGEVYFHGYPAVLVVPCGGEPPRLDRDGCITGRIAARDGALTLPPTRRVVRDDSPVDRDWFIHPQCRSSR
jgi:hypothetical protein